MTAQPVKRLGWQWLALMLAGCLLAGSVVAAGDAVAKKRKRSACQKLKGRDLAPAKSLKLVAKRINSSETDLKGCRLPHGKVRIFAIRLEGDTSSSDFTVHSVGGRWALVSARSGSQYASDSRVWVFDIDSGRVLYTISRWSCATAEPNCDPAPPSVGKGVVTNIGKAALAFVDQGMTTITGFGTNGKRKEFDSGPSDELPAGSLRLNNGVATWMHSGQQRSHPLP